MASTVFVDEVTKIEPDWAQDVNDFVYAETVVIKISNLGADPTAEINAAEAALPSTGGVIDARALTGTKTLSGPMFALQDRPIHFIGGNTTYEWNTSTITQAFWAGTVIEGNGTTFQPDAVDSAAANFTNNGLFNTRVTATTGTIVTGTRDILLADSSKANIGDVVGIAGAAGGDTAQETALSAGIDAVVTTIPVTSTANFSGAGEIYIGTEIIPYTGVDATNFLGCTRGGYGTTAASHLIGVNVQFMTDLRGVIKSKSGNTITLRDKDPAATLSVTSSPMLIGQQNIRFIGDLTIDGRQDRAGVSANMFGIKGRHASRMYIGENVKLLNVTNGGVMLDSSFLCNIKGRYNGNGRPAGLLGSDIWCFGNANENILSPVECTDGYTAISLDDRSTLAQRSDGKCKYNVTNMPSIEGYKRAYVAHGCDNNHANIPHAVTSATTVETAPSQGTTSRIPTDNTINAGLLESTASQAVDISGSNNKVITQSLTTSSPNIVAASNSLNVQPPNAITTELDDITDAINTGANKVDGYKVFNSTTGLEVFAAGNTAVSLWVLATGTTAHTPV